MTRRACIAAVVRLKTTVDFDRTEDQMYFIGPLLFWACAEMTCGFFVLCVPYLPMLVSDSGCPRRVKKMLGVSSINNTGQPNTDGGVGQGSSRVNNKANSNFTAGSYQVSRKKSRSTDMLDSTADASAGYYQIDEDGIGLNDLKTSESTEHLQRRHYGSSGVRVTRTVVVTRTTRS